MNGTDRSRERFLDGLRGWASLFVLQCHTFTFFLLKGSFGSSAYFFWSQGGISGILKFGIFVIGIVIYRFIGDGSLPVYVFFVLSGYVLTLGYVRTGKIRFVYVQALRRYPRLAPPILAVCVVACLLMKAGFMFNLRASEIFDGSDWIGRFYNFAPSAFGVLKFSLFDVFLQYNGESSYNFVLWTMHIEFVGSFVVLVMAVIGHDRWWRWAFYCSAAILLAAIGSPFASFCIGLTLSEFYYAPVFKKVTRSRAMPLGVVIALIFIVISPMIDQRLELKYEPTFNSACAGLLLFCVLVSPRLKSVLSTRLSRFLGSLSFPLYLVHPIMITSLGSLFAWRMSDGVSRTSLIVATGFVCIASSFVAAYMFLPVETASIRLARRFSNVVIGRSLPPERVVREEADAT